MRSGMLDHRFQNFPSLRGGQNDAIHQKRFQSVDAGPPAIQPSPSLWHAQDIQNQLGGRSPIHLGQNDRELLKTKIEIVGIFRYRSFRQESFDESPQHSR
jgi:hypothetical protein